jgi:hypothetical protein
MNDKGNNIFRTLKTQSIKRFETRTKKVLDTGYR